MTYFQVTSYYYDPHILDEGFSDEYFPGFSEWRKKNGVKTVSAKHALAASVYLTWWELNEVRVVGPSEA